MFDTVNAYYKFHSKIYDLTRWSILFGRNKIVEQLPKFEAKDLSILELGCGTGHHLKKLANYYPDSEITGVDNSEDMIKRASRRISGFDQIEVERVSCQEFLPKKDKYDLIFCSYSLSMFGEYHEFLVRINESLKDGGILVAVDFDKSPFTFFEKWMRWNHVDISGDLFKQLQVLYKEQTYETKKAYLGLWEYSLFLGYK